MLLGIALGALFLTIRPVGAQNADAPPTLANAVTVHDYAENGTRPITTFIASDPENQPIFWTLGGPDAASFTIAGGTLRFRSPPDYEVPRDRDEDPVTADAQRAGDNVYKVTVRFGAGGEDGMGGVDAYEGDDLGDIDLTINVTNVNEPGMVVISPMQPQIGTMLTAILTDEDNIAPGVGEWQWARSNSMNGPWEDIPALSTSMTYQPTEDDLNMYLRVTVVYVDRAGADSRTVQQVSDYKVRKDIVTSNQPPKFPDQKTLTGGTAIVRNDTDRFISETAAAGTPVGAPVTAFDDRTDIEVITYSLRDDEDTLADSDTNPDTPMHNDGHAASFDIDEKTGQITVGASARLNADGTPSATDPNPYNVVVRAVDGDGDETDIDVTIGILRAQEPPRIDRAYVTGRIPTATGTSGVTISAGDRAPTEMSHYELDRENAPATEIDTDLDTARDVSLEPATYYATDVDGDAISWSLDGPDAGRFIFEPATGATNQRPEATDSKAERERKLNLLQKATGESVTLAFRAGPDFEMPGDVGGNNVYEVTIVAKDPSGNMDELEVTVEVINSTDDNKAGSVSFENRQPEVATALKASFKDDDTPISQLKWQWYRQATAGTAGSVCDNASPETNDPSLSEGGDPAGVNERRHYVENETPDATWEAIDSADARTATYTPKAPTILNSDGTVNTDATTAASDVGRCLRATVTYRDAVDRTHTAADPDPTDDLDVTLEGTWQATERAVKAIDEQNDAPEFQDSDGNATTTYRDEVAENGAAVAISGGRTPAVLSAADPMEGEDDDSTLTPPGIGADILTYSLSGRDADAFTLIGTTANPTPTDAADDGTLTFKGGANYEGQREYRVRITATDPSGDSDFVDVIVDVTNVNERPGFTMGDTSVVYMENGMIPVDTYLAVDPEGSGITYSLVTAAIPAVDDDSAGDVAAVEADAFADNALFEIGSISGILSFKESPNFEDAQDIGTNADDNMYQVTVQATVSDNENPRHITTREVTVRVTNKNEPPVFSETTEALMITENPDDPEKEPPSAAGYLYLLNRGVGKPAANLPTAPDLDVGIPIVAVDDDNNGPLLDPAITNISTTRQLIQGLTYELSGADAGYFHVVPATGQILTLKKLDYESKNQFMVTLKATDPSGLYGMIDLDIEVIDVDEVPVPKILRLAGNSSHTVEENSTDALGEYTVVAGGGATVGSWSLEGADASMFMLDGSGDSTMLKFRSAPDYDAMADANSDNVYEVTLKVTDSSESDIYGTFPVTVTVTNVVELGTLSGMTDISVDEGTMDALATYTVSGGPTDGTFAVMLEGDDADDFTLGTGLELMFSSAPDYEMPADMDMDNMYMVTVKVEAGGEMSMVAVTVTVDNAEEAGTVTLDPTRPSVGTPITATLEDMDGVVSVEWQWSSSDAMDGTFTDISGATMATYTPVAADAEMYLMATATYTDGYDSGNMESMVTAAAVTDVAITDGPMAMDYMENGTDAVGTYTAHSTASISWSVEGDDAGDFNISSGGMLSFNASPDYEAPMDMDMDNTYMVTVVATAGDAMAMREVTVTVTNVDEAGTVTLSPTHLVVGTEVIAVVSDPDMSITNTAWQWARSADGTAYNDIAGATSDTYTVADADGGMYLQATASYDDGEGTGKSASAATTVSADVAGSYDTNGVPGIQISELFAAIDDYFAGRLTIAELFEVIDAYFGN